MQAEVDSTIRCFKHCAGLPEIQAQAGKRQVIATSVNGGGSGCGKFKARSENEIRTVPASSLGLS
jgi:hypothetical protein